MPNYYHYFILLHSRKIRYETLLLSRNKKEEIKYYFHQEIEEIVSLKSYFLIHFDISLRCRDTRT